MAKKRIFVGLKGEPLGIESGKKNERYVQGEAEAQIELEALVNPAMLISRLSYPVSIQYGESIIRVSPRSKEMVADLNKLGKLPEGLAVKRIKK